MYMCRMELLALCWLATKLAEWIGRAYRISWKLLIKPFRGKNLALAGLSGLLQSSTKFLMLM